MAQFKTSLVIRRSVEDVFTFVSNYQNSPRWVSGGLEHTKISAGPIGVGTVIRTYGRTLGLRIEATRVVTIYEPYSRYAFKSEYQQMPITTTFLFEPIADGTRLTVVVDGEPTGLFKATAPFVLGAIQRQFEGDLSRLKALLEAPKPTTDSTSTKE
ncbi:MAG TPA: SRPBCC family protein [Anaerolineae bacterium]|nr:SRPBCC family protein [Anaerolineae bacterium]